MKEEYNDIIETTICPHMPRVMTGSTMPLIFIVNHYHNNNSNISTTSTNLEIKCHDAV